MKKHKKYAFGGSLAGDLGQLAPLVGMIPGVGTIAGPALSLIGGLFGDKKASDPRNPLTSSPGNYYLGGPVLPPQESTAVAPRNYFGLAPQAASQLDELIKLNQAAAGKFQQNFDINAKPTVQARPASMRDRYIERAQGGMINLSDEAYKVNGNPNVTDSVPTSFKGNNLRLDDQEVIDAANNFVYSNKIKNPATGKSFAKDAEKLEMRKGKAQKAEDRFNDPHAANTIKHTTTALNSLAKNQELVALLKGKRSPTKSMQNGGPVDPLNPWLPFMYSPNAGASNAMGARPARRSNPGRTLPAPAVQTPPKSFVPGLPNDTQGPLNYGDLFSADPNANFSGAIDDIEAYERMRIAPLLNGTPGNPQVSSGASGTASTSYTNDPRVDRSFTVGDALQVGSLVNSFARLRGGPEKEQANYDNSKITRNVYDVNNALQSNASSFANSSNNIDTSSPQLRRALQNQMLASKMKADNSALTQYDQMNQGARSEYENRVSNQQRYNVGQRTYTNDINARNKGAYDSAIQNAFGNLSNFGVGLNQRKQAYDALDLYGSTYKDVYSRILKTLGQNG